MLAAFLVAAAGCASAAAADEALLRHYPMVLAHDAATTYMRPPPPAHLMDTLLFNWTRTQPAGGLGTLLDCGARAFDWRPYLSDDGRLVMHHGDVVVRYPMASAVAELTAWLGDHDDELVVMYVSHCDEAACAGAMALLEEAGAAVVDGDDCRRVLPRLTVAEARARGRLPGGGSLLAVGGGCVQENYDPTQTCCGLGAAGSPLPWDGLSVGAQRAVLAGAVLAAEAAGAPDDAHCCDDVGGGRMAAFERLMRSLDAVAGERAPHPPATALSEAQAIWQESDASVVMGVLRRSSLLNDERTSGLNAEIARRVRLGEWPKLGLVLLNNVCDDGPEVAAALAARGAEDV